MSILKQEDKELEWEAIRSYSENLWISNIFFSSSERKLYELCYIWLKEQLFNYSRIAPNSQTGKNKEQIKDNFFEKLEELTNNLSKVNMQQVLGISMQKSGINQNADPYQVIIVSMMPVMITQADMIFGALNLIGVVR